MKIWFVSLKQLIYATVAGVSLATVTLPQVSLANPDNSQFNTRKDPLDQGFNQNSGQNPFDVLQLMHNAQIGNLNPEFGSQSSQQLNNAAAEFRKKQQQQLQRAGQTGVQQNNTTSNSKPLLIITPDSQN